MLLSLSLSLLLIAVSIFFLWMFFKFSPAAGEKNNSLFIFNSLVLLVSAAVCLFYSFSSYKSYVDAEDPAEWIVIAVGGSAVIFSMFLAAGAVIRILIFRKMYSRYSEAFLMVPPAASFILAAVHFIREGNTLLASAVFVALFPLIVISVPRVAKAAQVVLLLAAVEWIRAGYVLIAFRIENDEPWLRVLIIFAGVVCFTVLSALAFYTNPLKKRFGIEAGNGGSN